MSLEKYKQKRDFSQTKEPAAGKATGKKLSFVVQRHHASHLHYDFRLEMDGVLKSWAVPKGPSLNPGDKRLAMMVEDHPFDYRNFEGEIPAGNYGGGVVTIFDKGTYSALEKGTEKDLKKGLNEGDLKFRLNGKILKGEFVLVRLKNSDQNAWLLIKHNDKYAVKRKFNIEDLVPAAVKKIGLDFKKKSKGAGKGKSINHKSPSEISKKQNDEDFQPMQARLSEHIFDDPDWIYERKLDGYRALAYVSAKGAAKLISRNGIDFSATYPSIVNALKGLELDAVIDGEIIVLDKAGKTSFQLLQDYDDKKEGFQLRFYVFDLLSLNGHDIRGMELIKRKELLSKLIQGLANPSIIYNDHRIGAGEMLFKEAQKLGWEGIIAKNSLSHYLSNKRTDSWQKFKLGLTQEAIIIGYSKPEGGRTYFGALALAIYDGDELTYIGNCGSGYNDKALNTIYEQMQPLIITQKLVKQAVHKEQSFTWIRPELVCEVTYAEWTADRHLRHPVFRGLRTDKDPKDIVRELVEEAPEYDKNKDDMAVEKEEQFGSKKVKLTNLDKLYWPKEKISKGELVNYYQQVAAYILPHLKDKPLSLNRQPNGITKPGFFQKDLDIDKIPSWIKYAPMHSDSNDKDIDYLICNDEATLLWMVNLGCIEINPWLSTYKVPESPLFAVLDLDPHDIDFNEVIAVALTAKKLLDQRKISSFIKTSGSKGLHIFIPLAGNYNYDITREFIHYLGQLIYKLHPDTTSLERSPSKREGRIYLDFLQNSRGQTIAAPYSVRPKPGATVSAPLKWEEVKIGLKVQDFHIFNMPDRLKDKGDLWKDMKLIKNDLKKALKLF
ncbi:MAG: DNA ligase D [Candidatus Pedobacter colombiensis]|uniref:DNA ligase (ATP) n=1 Tax=Candidatus Pedobacter colombiensis TaxID=3121371 RepID=A0AAJ5WE57_9SPHI|nr:DNA ligase D [Pedobacter sp.]WEK20982.1 MAG: DNA ligase D [Pedobacter sp.]